MPQIRFTANLHRHVASPEGEYDGDSVAKALDAYFDAHPGVRGYVLNDQGALRRHMAIFVNGTPLHDRTKLSDTIDPDATIDVMQALSGG
jgi:hypothetical protein